MKYSKHWNLHILKLTVHEIRLSAAIRTDNAREIKEWSDALFTRIGLEILEFEVGYRHGAGWVGEWVDC